jgi:hypothetical protein
MLLLFIRQQANFSEPAKVNRSFVAGGIFFLEIFTLEMVAKETGHLWPYYIYMTVFIRNAANLAHILLKASRTTFTSEIFYKFRP